MLGNNLWCFFFGGGGGEKNKWIHTKKINTPRGKDEELENVNLGGTWSNHWALKS